MFDAIATLLKQQNVLHHANHGITICSVKDQLAGIDLIKALLYAVVDRRTALYLSGGRTPKELYALLAKEESLSPGAVGMVDERFGQKFHERSNETMIKETGLLRYFEMRDIKFYSMLSLYPGKPHPHPDLVHPCQAGGLLRPAPHREKESFSSPSPFKGEGGGEGNNIREMTAQLYDEKVRELHAVFQRSVALLGIGSDGHTAGIAGNRKNFKNPLFDKDQQHLMVSEFNDENGMFGERVTMTFLGLSMMDLLVVLVFGDDKREALEWMFGDGSEEEIPARFYKRPEIAQKTFIITDQAV